MNDSVAVVRPFRGVSAAERVRQRRDALLDAGLSALAEGSRASVTVDDVIARAGLSKRYFYENFHTRNDLFVALGDRLVEQVTAAARTALTTPATDMLSRVQEVVESVVSVLISDPRNARLFVDMMGGDERTDTVDRTEHAIAAMLIDGVVADIRVSQKERIRLDMAAVVLIVGAAQAISDWLDGRIELSRAELVEEIVRLVAAAIRTVRPDL
ncbi:TetR/AcrR family transcriptional regulator [Skermania sp. ID1734]|uniref:TetR/AcrR family transcriptional regulator n=1 Tax=Skermania sp. ID1734 TaxID=2597516 RepID=UPI001181506B|nr:TetR/AcrR family transcriptional regulator [Skermania sp. ID1734]TSE01581.1 TetR/AcrR family transcriptional regulator [Skermania sp. ID1734]